MRSNFFFDDDDFQNMFVYRPTFNMLRVKKDKSTGYVIDWKVKGLFKSKLLPLHDAFSSTIK